MTDGSTQDIGERLEQIDVTLPAGPWKLWTSCSYRRISGPRGADGGVLHAYKQRSDGHPDLSMPEEQLQALVDLRNALPAVREELARLRKIESLHAERLPSRARSTQQPAEDVDWRDMPEAP